MKKIFIICSAVIAAMTLTTNADAQISVSAGYNLISHTTKIKGGESTSTPQQLSGIFINGSYCYELMTEEWGVLSVEPGLTWSFGSTKIANQDVGRAISGSREKRREHYLDLPINARYDYDLMPGKVKLSGFAGPNLIRSCKFIEITRGVGRHMDCKQTEPLYWKIHSEEF